MNLKKLRSSTITNWVCKKDCFACCWPIVFLKQEKILMDLELESKWLKEPPQWKVKKYCEYLDNNWKCSVYNNRPLVCRMFWNIEKLKCQFRKQTKFIKEDNKMQWYSKRCMEEWVTNKCFENLYNEMEKEKNNPLLK